MIKFLYGTDTNKKNEYLLQALRADAEAGMPSILIVPEQRAVNAERMTLDALPPSAQLTLEVLNFSRLYNRVCRDRGGLCYSYITKPIKHLLMWKTLREVYPLLSVYAENAESDSAFADTMLSGISEMKMSSVSTDMLEEAARECKPYNPLLSDRLRDIALIYGTYDMEVSKKYSDASDDLSRLCAILDGYDFFDGKNVYIDSFTSFTAVEHRVIEKIFKTANNATISIPLPSPDYGDIATAGIEKSLKTLKKNADRWDKRENIILPSVGNTYSPLNYLYEKLWNFSDTHKEKPSSEGRIVMEICDNAYSEAEAAASHILALLRSGARCRDIVIVARNAEKYKGIIEPSLERADIPFFMSEKTDICTLAPVKFILSALRIKQYNWRKSDVISHIKTGLCDFSMRESDIFEEYINTWSICGSRFTNRDWTMNPDGFTDRLTERGRVILSTANDVRKRLCEPLEEFFILLDASQTVADMCRALYRYTEKAELREKTLRLAEKELSYGNKKAASELASLYDTLLSSLADIGEALEGTPCSADDFSTILKTVLDNTEIGTIPTSIDEVTVGSAAMLRAQSPKYVFVLGLCEGEFPASAQDTGLLNTADRNTLAELDIELGEDSEVRASDELMFVRNAFSLPTERLYLFTSQSDITGAGKTPSLPFRRVEKLFCDLKAHRYLEYDLEYLSGSPQSAAAHLRNIQSPSDREAAKAAVSEHIPLVKELSDSDITTKECRISPEVVKRIIGDKVYISPSSLERYALCPFSYYASYMLSLRETKYGRFASNQMGSFIHYVMENILRFALAFGKELPSKEEIHAEVAGIVEKYINIISPDASLNTKRMEHLYKKLRSLSLLITDSVCTELADSDFRPAFFELHIDGKNGNPCPVELPLSDGAKIVLKGYIDRVDIWQDGNEVYVRIVDYKTGNMQFSLSELEYGLNTQMLLYLFSVCTAPGEKFKRLTSLGESDSPIPAGVTYLSSAISKEVLNRFDVSDEEILQRSEQKLMRSGIILDDEKVIRAMSHSASKEILMGVTQKDGKFVGKPLLDSEALDGLFDQIQNTLTEIGNNIYSGIADCAPLLECGHDPCKFCKVQPMCRKNNF